MTSPMPGRLATMPQSSLTFLEQLHISFDAYNLIPKRGNYFRYLIVRPPGLEPGTCGLRVRCSTN